MRSLRRPLAVVMGLILLLSVVLPVAATPAAEHGDLAQGKGVAWSAGRYMFIANGQPVMFIYEAWKDADGAVFGSYYYWQQSINLTVWGPVTCINVVGNHAWMAGNVEGVSGNPDFADLVGTESWWQVFDNTYYGMPDVSTGLGAAAAPAGTDWCNDMPDPRFPWDLMNGNLVVRDHQ